MGVKYDLKDFNPETLDKEHIDRLAVEQVPHGAFVLDIGCATGFMGQYLRMKKNCTVFGIDVREEEIKIAKKSLNKAFVADIEKESSVWEILKETKNKKFDVILATSVIEHLKEYNIALSYMKRLLKPNGIIVASTPNVVHWSMRLEILQGRFNYTEYGILDNTHLHLFTIESFKKYFEEGGFTVEKTVFDTVGGGYPRISRFLGKFFPRIFGYQMLIVAKKKS